ncbi:MAG: hypothetical protein AAFW88_07110, partial [Pseudomonadota bacterium]
FALSQIPMTTVVADAERRVSRRRQFERLVSEVWLENRKDGDTFRIRETGPPLLRDPAGQAFQQLR